MKKIMTGLAVTLFTVLLIANPVAANAAGAGYPTGALPPSQSDNLGISEHDENAAIEKAKSDKPGVSVPESFNVNDEVVLTLDESTGVKVGDRVTIYVFSEPTKLGTFYVQPGLKVTLPAGALAGLPDGKHTIAVYDEQGNLIAATAIVKNGEIAALDTADGSSFSALGILPIVALVGVAGVGFVAYRRFSASKN